MEFVCISFLWLFYYLIVAEGIQFGNKNNGDNLSHIQCCKQYLSLVFWTVTLTVDEWHSCVKQGLWLAMISIFKGFQCLHFVVTDI